MPIIDDRAFRASLLRILKRESTDKRARGGHHDDWSVATAKYYAPCIEEANRRLKALRDHHVADRIKPALQKKQRRSLLGALGARLEFFAWSYHLALAAANYNVLPNPTVDQVARLNDPAHPHTHYNTMAGQALKTITDQFINYLTDVVNHVDTDWNRIKDVFFRNWDLVELLEIGMTGSDTHKGGKQVLILEFKGRRPPAAQITAANYIQNRQVFRPTKRLKLVYKPSDLTLDYLMVGNTQRVKAAHPPGIPPGDSLFELINTLIINHGMNADPTFTGANRPATIQLPTYPILPRVSGAANIATAYGYIKFLKSRPKPEVNLQNISFPPHPADWDWVTDSTDDLIDYYRLYGWYIAIALNFGIADAHNQNLIVHKKKPYLIDLEISFKQRNKTLGHTGFGDAMTRDLGQLGQGSDKNHFFYKHGATLSWTTGTQAATYINAGITEACDLLANDPGGHIENWLTTSLSGVLVRYTPRQTRFYGTELRGIHASSLQPAPNLTTVPKGPFFADFRRHNGYMTATMAIWYSDNGSTEEQHTRTFHRPNYVMADVDYDWTDFVKCDYPAYYRVLDQRDLLNARGQIVTPIPPRLPWNDPTVNGPRPRTIAGPHYFDHYPSILRCEEDLLALGHGRTGRAFPLMPMELDQIDHGGAEFTALNQIFATAANPINLSIYAVGETQRPGAHWRVIDDDPPNPRRVFHILLAPTAATPNRIEVYETGSALDMVVDQYQLFKNNAAYRGNIINGLHGEVNGLYPRGDVGAIFNAF